MTTEHVSQSDLFGGANEMAPDRLSSVPPFTLAGITWRCWVTGGGQHYEWRSDDGRLTAGRSGAEFWARADGFPCGEHHPSLREAMVAAIQASRSAAA